MARQVLLNGPRLDLLDSSNTLHCTLFGSIGYFAYSILIRAVSTTVENSLGFYPMSYHFTAAVRTLWGHGLDCTLKAIKNVELSRCNNFKCFVVLIATCFTACHRKVLLLLRQKIQQ